MTDDKERIAALETRLDAHLVTSKQGHERNNADHAKIMEQLKSTDEKIDEMSLFQNKLKWGGRMFLLIIGTVVGFLIHHAANIWDMLPMHGHTH